MSSKTSKGDYFMQQNAKSTNKPGISGIKVFENDQITTDMSELKPHINILTYINICLKLRSITLKQNNAHCTNKKERK